MAPRTSTVTKPSTETPAPEVTPTPAPTETKPTETPVPTVTKFVPCDGKGKKWGGNLATREVTCPECGASAASLFVNFRDTKNGIQPATVPAHRAAKEVPVTASKSAGKGESKKAEAKNVLAVTMLNGVVSFVNAALADEETAKLLAHLGTPAEIRQITANLIHHFPTGKDADGKRVWDSEFPTPDRSEWK